VNTFERLLLSGFPRLLKTAFPLTEEASLEYARAPCSHPAINNDQIHIRSLPTRKPVNKLLMCASRKSLNTLVVLVLLLKAYGLEDVFSGMPAHIVCFW